jgi:uncharacterized Tic20 family protein
MELDETKNEYKTWAIFCHLITFISFGIPFGNFVGVLTLWLLKRKESDLVNENGKEAINFQILCYLVCIICLLLWPFGIGIVIALFFGIYACFEIVLAAIKANQGQVYRYRFSLRLLK